jgi:hypothetical protein
LSTIKESYYDDEIKDFLIRMLQKAELPVVRIGGTTSKKMPLGHIFLKAFGDTGLKLTEAYYPFIVSNESEILDEEGMFKDDDKVNHPTHYQSYNPKVNIECIDAMRAAFGDEAVAIWCKLNAFKYNWRSDSKGKNIDIGKAIWYLNKYLELNK